MQRVERCCLAARIAEAFHYPVRLVRAAAPATAGVECSCGDALGAVYRPREAAFGVWTVTIWQGGRKACCARSVVFSVSSGIR